MSKNEPEIYVVRNVVGPLESKIVYVGNDKEEPQKLCDDHQSKVHPCYIQVWKNGEQKYVTRQIDG
jgi:hypothetical protein